MNTEREREGKRGRKKIQVGSENWLEHSGIPPPPSPLQSASEKPGIDDKAKNDKIK